MDQPQPPPVPEAVPVQPLATDLPCARCGYNLRGLRTDHLCPECGTPIERSLQGNLLHFADPGWLDTLRLGVALKLWMVVIALVVGIGGTVAAAVGLFVVQAAMSLVAGALGLWAIWLITAPEPNIATNEDPMSLRRLLRGCAVIGFLGGQVQTLTGAAPGAMPGIVVLVAIGVMMLVGLVAMFGEFVYLRRFARRIPNDKLADNTTVVMWGFCGTIAVAVIVAVVLAIVFIPLAAAAGGGGGAAAVATGGSAAAAGGTTVLTATGQPPPWAMGVVGIFGCGVVIGLLVFGIWYIVLLFQYHGALRNALAEAQRLAQLERVESPM